MQVRRALQECHRATFTTLRGRELASLQKRCGVMRQQACGHAIFFFAAEAEAVHKLIGDHVKVVDAKSDKNWHSLFDSADERVKEGNTDSDIEVDFEVDEDVESDAA